MQHSPQSARYFHDLRSLHLSEALLVYQSDAVLRKVLHDVYDILQKVYDKILPLLDSLLQNLLGKYETMQSKYEFHSHQILLLILSLLDIYGRNHSLVQQYTNSYLLNTDPKQLDLYHLYEWPLQLDRPQLHHQK